MSVIMLNQKILKYLNNVFGFIDKTFSSKIAIYFI